jgi:hypothetical protein
MWHICLHGLFYRRKSFYNFKTLKETKSFVENILVPNFFYEITILRKTFYILHKSFNSLRNFNQDEQFKLSNLFILTFQNLQNFGMLHGLGFGSFGW